MATTDGKQKKKPEGPAAPQDKKELDHKGTTGRFMPCIPGRWAHPAVRLAIEVRYSLFTKESTGKDGKKLKSKICHYWLRCGFCGARFFLHSWRHEYGLNVFEAEREGYTLPELTEERRVELLAELGLKPVQPQSQPMPPSQWPPYMTHPSHPYQPR